MSAAPSPASTTCRAKRKSGIVDPQGTRGDDGRGEETIEPLSRIIEELNERFGLNLGPGDRVTLDQVMGHLHSDLSLDASARVNARENVRLSFDEKVHDVIQEIIESNFDLYKRITDDLPFGQAVKNALFDVWIERHREIKSLLNQQKSKTLEFKSSLRWNLKEDCKDDKRITQAILKTVAAFLNTEGGDLLIGVADDGTPIGLDHDRLESDDKFMLHLAQVVRNGLGARASTCIDPKMQVVEGKTICLVSCQRSPEPVFLKWKGIETEADGDFYVRSGPGSVKLSPEDTEQFIRTRFKEASNSVRGSENGGVLPSP